MSLVYGKFTLDKMYQIFSESDEFCGRYDRRQISVFFLLHSVYGFCEPSGSLERQVTIASCTDDVEDSPLLSSMSSNDSTSIENAAGDFD